MSRQFTVSTYLRYHVVWVFKYRRRILNPGVCGYIRELMSKLL